MKLLLHFTQITKIVNQINHYETIFPPFYIEKRSI